MEEAIANKFNIYTIAYGCAASAAAFVLAHGKKRYATKNSSIMLHSIAYELTYDYHKFVKKYTDFASKASENLLKALAKRCGYTTYAEQKRFMCMVEDTVWLSPEEAIQFKIIDGIWSYQLERPIIRK